MSKNLAPLAMQNKRQQTSVTQIVTRVTRGAMLADILHAVDRKMISLHSCAPRIESVN